METFEIHTHSHTEAPTETHALIFDKNLFRINIIPLKKPHG